MLIREINPPLFTAPLKGCEENNDGGDNTTTNAYSVRQCSKGFILVHSLTKAVKMYRSGREDERKRKLIL